jgi:hypothetical protein
MNVLLLNDSGSTKGHGTKFHAVRAAFRRVFAAVPLVAVFRIDERVSA